MVNARLCKKASWLAAEFGRVNFNILNCSKERSENMEIYCYRVEKCFQVMISYFIRPSMHEKKQIMLRCRLYSCTSCLAHFLFRFDKRKGFYCQVTSQGGTQCLGKGKGRHYTPMDRKSQTFLGDYYKEPNKNLVDLLQQLNKPLPDWLEPSRWLM